MARLPIPEIIDPVRHDFGANAIHACLRRRCHSQFNYRPSHHISSQRHQPGILMDFHSQHALETGTCSLQPPRFAANGQSAGSQY